MNLIPIFHYYGDYVRRIFIGIAVVLIVALPFYKDLMPELTPLGTVIFVAILVFQAGFTSPTYKIVAWTDTLIALVGMVIFQYAAVLGYGSDPMGLFLAREVLAVAFLFALYYSSKTVRGMKSQ